MRLIKIPEGVDVQRNNIDKRKRFFENLYTIIELSQLNAVELLDLANWFTPVMDLREEFETTEIKLRDTQYEKLKTIVNRFEGFRGLGAIDVVLAIHNARYVDETKSLTESIT